MMAWALVALLGMATLALAEQPRNVEDLCRFARGEALPDAGSTKSNDPAPSEEELAAIVTKATDYAAAYGHALPNFLCEQTTVFYKTGQAAASTWAKSGANWRVDETVVEDVRYHDGAEEYRTRMVNDKPSTAPVADIRAFYTRGEFGGLLIGALDPASQTRYRWDHWEALNGKRMAVIHYEVARAQSRYTVCCRPLGTVTVNGVRHQRQKAETTGYRGVIYTDPDTGAIAILTLENTEIPAGLSLDEGRNVIEYKPVMLNDQPTWLPARAIHFSRQGTLGTRSEMAFSKYRSFGAHATIEFPTETQPQPLQ